MSAYGNTHNTGEEHGYAQKGKYAFDNLHITKIEITSA
jgi:uncharacterized protein YkuJ